ncbi:MULTISPECIES: glycosyltransferase family 2 protein [Stenotrophomonas maltophilia group]|jgi:glycosyltransferase involved in cell wall biosynthesis|uniref:Glycosyl transferase n=1 Tax=Stenotrophomonas maltophilia TaxID=40324 RepID=A0A246I7I4_STEMA|nr:MULTISPECIES: glycosyltransferase family 2 protein [Stenotrophomonas maltophilia group]CRR78368.1 N-glycosyltransferase [Pseudomonas aeruginosa]MBA0228215.1 glycosyltransferase family 2 protein [Stenotrophomonas maltophilia]MBA0367691.1 glycosyltransferase family 2 protein [Stenotrophomonas maltophilia]MBA0401861.1 glycosyltransferase family 2 protein [Stenotrophomonas maltophilia]MBA0405790.1 glycosyltransferase family 2 protein [Stenotrophomonas maltophilia]
MSLEYSNVAVVIPAYNEGSAIKDTIHAIPGNFPKIIVIDDGSRDDTHERVRETRATLIRHPINLGQGAGLQTGIDAALLDPAIEYIVTFDADGQHRIEDVERMLAYAAQHKVQIVMGSRFLGKAVNMPRMKRVILKAAVWFSNVTSGVHLTDTHNGLRVIHRSAAERLKLELPDFSHASEIVERIGQQHFSYAEVPVTIIYSEYSRSKGQSMINAINIAFDAILRKVIK